MVHSGVPCNSLQTSNQTIRDAGDEGREKGEEFTPLQSHRQRRLFFLNAPGGTGKTFVTNATHNFLKSEGKKLIVVATSDAAAQLLRKRRTAHFTFRIPIPFEEDSTCNMAVIPARAAKIERADLII